MKTTIVKTGPTCKATMLTIKMQLVILFIYPANLLTGHKRSYEKT